MGGPPPNVRDMFSVKIDNLSTKTDKFELRDAFAKFGTVGDVFIPWDEQRQPRSYGFVRFLERRHAEDAVAAMDGRDFGGSEIRCQLAASEKPLNLPIRGGDCEDDRRGGRRCDGSSESRSRSRRRHRRRRRHSRRSDSRSRSRRRHRRR